MLVYAAFSCVFCVCVSLSLSFSVTGHGKWTSHAELSAAAHTEEPLFAF